MDKFHPGYFGKIGMRQFHLLRNRNFTPTCNIDKLFNIAGEGVYDAAKNGGEAHGRSKMSDESDHILQFCLL